MSRLDVGTEKSLPQILRRMVVPAIFVAALFMVLLWRTPDPKAARAETLIAGPAMGTRYTVKVVTSEPLTEKTRAILESGVRETLESVDAAMSTWRDDSEISRFNRHGAEPFDASPEILKVVGAALDVARQSGGAFDVTVGPLVEAWGFGPEGVVETPSRGKLAELLAATGSRHLEVDRYLGTIRKDTAGLRVDLSALAKGYAVDRVAEVLDEAGFQDYMVEIGGEVVARGRNVAGRSWRIGIEAPNTESRAVRTTVVLDGAALATSGDYRNFRLENGERVSHIIDPRNGRPVAHSLTSVSVIAESCMIADAWATALTVLGPDEGVELAGSLGLSALFIFRQEDGRLSETSTGEFETFRSGRRPEERDTPS